MLTGEKVFSVPEENSATLVSYVVFNGMMCEPQKHTICKIGVDVVNN